MRISLKLRRGLFAISLLIPCALFVVIFAYYPIIYSFYLSLHKIILALPGLGEPFVGLQNYRDLIHDEIARRALYNTFAFVFISTSFELLFGLIIALIIHQSFRGRAAVRAAILVPWAIPTAVSSQMWKFIFNDKYGLLNFVIFGSDTSSYRAWLAEPFYAFTGIVAADVWKTSSFAALLILAGLQTIPEELYEAARIDGAGVWQRFRRVTMPLLKPALLIAL